MAVIVLVRSRLRRKNTSMQTDRQMIEELHEKDAAASKTRDLATLMSLWTDDSVALPPSEAPIIGRPISHGSREIWRRQVTIRSPNTPMTSRK